MRRVILSILLMAGACSRAAEAEDLLSNPGFESRSFSGWITKGRGWKIDEKTFSEGAASALCMVEKGDPPGLRACLQSLSGIEAGRLVEVSVDFSGIDVVKAVSSKACLAVLCMDDKGSVVKEYRSSVILPEPAFQTIAVDDAVILPGTAQVYVMLVVEVYQIAVDNDWWRFDNVRIRIR